MESRYSNIQESGNEACLLRILTNVDWITKKYTIPIFMNIFIFDARVCLYSVLSTFPALRVVLREAIGCPKAVPLKKIVVVPDNEPSRYKNLKRTKAADSISFSLHIYHTKYGVIPL